MEEKPCYSFFGFDLTLRVCAPLFSIQYILSKGTGILYVVALLLYPQCSRLYLQILFG